MSKNIEIEKTYLAKFLPKNINKFRSNKIIDIYIPPGEKHPKLRIRKCNNQYLITKKTPKSNKTASIQIEENIQLTKKEFSALSRASKNKVSKIRYYYLYKKKVAEIDVFLEKLRGLVLVDFEFKNKEELESFEMPDFCLADVSEEEVVAGGILSRQSFSSIKNDLIRFNYKKIEHEKPDHKRR
ncbi:MAG: hypothetical protein PHP37_02965 [Patescibacteria group bacterium]|nr:hypothetical protein [Patescibacteria group bacterium]